MKFYILSLILLAALQSNAASRIKYLPGDFTMMVNVTATDIYGHADSDSEDLYQVMNVDEQDSTMGKGKSIVSTAKDFNLICSKEKKLCTILVRKSALTVISGQRKYASFKLTGPEAEAFTNKFKLNENGEAYFQATDKLFKIIGTKESFLFESSGE